jgi:hypothetical protein
MICMNFNQIQQAFQWWFGQQFQQQWRESDRIRNHVMQEVFVMRRGIELSQQDAQIMYQNSQSWLEQLANLQQSLERLSDHLSPLFIEDSLPLAIQALATDWQQETQCPIQMDLPCEWQTESQESSQIVLSTFSQLLRLSSARHSGTEPIQVKLRQTGDFAELSVQVHNPDLDLGSPDLLSSGSASSGSASSGSESSVNQGAEDREWQYISRCFHCLTTGHCAYVQTGKTLTWLLRWQTTKDWNNSSFSKLEV